MSIFDVDDNIDKEENCLPPYSRLKSMQYDFACTEGMDEHGSDFKLYCKVISKADSFYRPFIPGLPTPHVIRQYLKVVFSRETPKIRKFKNKEWFKVKDDEKLPKLLGEYRSKDEKFGECIILYVENIKSSSIQDVNSSKFKSLLLSTYIHELYHAYFRSGDRYEPEVEEPLAEFGTLFCMNAMACMGIVEEVDVESYRKIVAAKKSSLPIYAFGEHIYQLHDKQKSWRMGMLLDAYKLKIQNDKEDFSLNLLSWNPKEWDEAYKKLCKTLNYVD